MENRLRSLIRHPILFGVVGENVLERYLASSFYVLVYCKVPASDSFRHVCEERFVLGVGANNEPSGSSRSPQGDVIFWIVTESIATDRTYFDEDWLPWDTFLV